MAILVLSCLIHLILSHFVILAYHPGSPLQAHKGSPETATKCSPSCCKANSNLNFHMACQVTRDQQTYYNILISMSVKFVFIFIFSRAPNVWSSCPRKHIRKPPTCGTSKSLKVASSSCKSQNGAWPTP